MAWVFIADYIKQSYLFEEAKPKEEAILLSHCKYIGVYHTFLYDVLRAVQHLIGYTISVVTLLNNLVIMQVFDPASKLRSTELMETYFGIRHRRRRFYESATTWLQLKESVEKKTLAFARKHYGFNFSLIFYDVTTLYFETFAEDEFRMTGFSKDNKS